MSTEHALRRMFEWSLAALLIAVIVWALLDKARDVRSAAELSAFRYSLGALRVALVLDRMRATVSSSKTAGATSRNPFLLLASQPANYVGEIPLVDAQAGAIASGAWFFDGHCPCIGYRLRDDRRFLATTGGTVMVFPLSTQGVLAARESYVWRSEVID